MKFKLALLFMVITMSLSAQEKAAWTKTLSGNAKDILFHNSTGIPIIATSKAFIGLDPDTQEFVWEIKRSGLTAMSEDAADYYEVPVSQLAFINGNVINVVTGKVILDNEKDGIKGIKDYHFMPDRFQLLIEGIGEGKVKLFCVDMKNNESLWGTVIDNATLGEKITNSSASFSASSFIPDVIDNKLVYKSDKNIMVLDAASGKILWEDKCKPYKYVANQATGQIFIAEKRGGLMALTGMGAEYGKEFYGYDFNTGKESWKKRLKMKGNIRFYELHGDEILIVHGDGMNYYNMKTGEPRWKKDFEENRISSVVETNRGLEVLFKGNRKQLVDKSTGKGLWKKDKKLPYETEGDVVMTEDNSIKLSNGTLYPNPGNWVVEFNDGKFRNIAVTSIAAFDGPNEKLVRLVDGGIMIHDLTTTDAKSNKMVKLKFKEAMNNITVMDGSGYFIYGEHGYSFVDFSGNVKANENYKIPGEGMRKLVNAAMDIGQAASVAVATKGMVDDGIGTMGSAFYGDPKFAQQQQQGERNFRNAAYAHEAIGEDRMERFRSFKESEEAAYFFTKNDNKDKVLKQVNKSTGKETAEYKFDDNTPIYQIDKIANKIYYAHKDKLYVFEKQ